MVVHFGLIPKISDVDAKECDKTADGKIFPTKLSIRCMSGQSDAAEHENLPIKHLGGCIELILYESRFWLLPTLSLIYW
jgi:hypothetical protein